MEISSLLLRLIFLSLPGIFTYLIYHKLVRKKSKKDWEDILKITVFSLLNYLMLYLIAFLLNILSIISYQLNTYNAVFNEKQQIPGNEIILASLIAVVSSYAFAYISKKNWINKIGQFLRVTNLLSDNDVWEDFFDQNSKWVYVRDDIRELIYFGYVDLYSESEKNREIVLKDVEVYSETDIDQKILYELQSIYISREVDYITVEIPKFKGDENDKKKRAK